MSMRKLTLLILSLSSGFLVGCGGAGDGSDAPENTSSLLPELQLVNINNATSATSEGEQQTTDPVQQTSPINVSISNSETLIENLGNSLGGVRTTRGARELMDVAVDTSDTPDTVRITDSAALSAKIPDAKFSAKLPTNNTVNTKSTLTKSTLTKSTLNVHNDTCPSGGTVTYFYAGDIIEYDLSKEILQFDQCIFEGIGTLDGDFERLWDVALSPQLQAPCAGAYTTAKITYDTLTFKPSDNAFNEVSISGTLESCFTFEGYEPDADYWTSHVDSYPSLEVTVNDQKTTINNFISKIEIEITDGFTGDGSFRLAVSGEVTSDQLGGTYTVETPTELVGAITEYQFQPSEGIVKYSGNDNSTMTLTFSEGNIVTVDIDTDGDGLMDSSEIKTLDALDWESFLSL